MGTREFSEMVFDLSWNLTHGVVEATKCELEVASFFLIESNTNFFSVRNMGILADIFEERKI